MSIELTVLLSVVSVSAALYFGLKSSRRAQKADDQKEATDMTMVVVKLENINNGINEIKSDLRNVRDEVKDLRERLAKAEESLKSAWKRIDDLSRRGEGEA